MCVKNITNSFHEIWWIWPFFIPVKKKSCVKIIENFTFPSREKKTHPWKNPKKCPWKLSTASEKFEKSVRESHFPSVKKVEKRPKKAFTGTFNFHGKKKKRCPLGVVWWIFSWSTRLYLTFRNFNGDFRWKFQWNFVMKFHETSSESFKRIARHLKFQSEIPDFCRNFQ